MHLYRPIRLRKLFSLVSGVLIIQGSIIFVTFLAGLLIVQAGILVGSPERFALFNEQAPSILKNEASLCIGAAPSALSAGQEALPAWTSLAKLDDARMSLQRASLTSLVPTKSLVPSWNTQSLVPSSNTRLYRIADGDSLAQIWSELGANGNGGLKAQKAFDAAGAGKVPLKKGDELLFRFDERGDITDVYRKLSDGTQIILTGSSLLGYQPTIRKPQFVEVERVVSGSITHNFSESAAQAGLSYSIVDELVDLFSDRLDFNRDLQPGDIFTVIFSEKKCDGADIVQPGVIKAVSIHNQGRMLVAIRHEGKDGTVRYFDEQGHILGDYFLRYPLTFTRISSVFSDARLHPVLKKSRPHNGVDFAAPYGTPVRAVADGVLEVAGYKGSAGNMVRIKHDKRYTTEYMHLSKITPGLKVGSHVTRGQIIGAVGKTGLASGSHLHFGFFDNGKYVDPLKVDLPVLSNHQDPIPANYLEATLRTLREQHDTIKLAAKRDEKGSKV